MDAWGDDCRYCDAVTSNFVYDVCDNCSGYANLAKQRRRAQANEVSNSMNMSTLSEYIAKIERDMLDRLGMPNFVLMGTPSASGMYFDGAPLWRNKFICQWNVTGTALEAEERRWRRDDHVQALQHALTSQKTDAAVCPGCFETVQFTKNDCLEHHPPGSVPCPWSGHQRASVEHAIAMRAAENKAYQDAGVTLHDYCACGRIMPLAAKYCKKCEPKPPTLREWLGPRVADLGPWADVLREQPVAAVWIERWEWVMYQGKWHLNAHGKQGTPSGISEYAIVHAALGTTDRQWFPPWYDDGLVSGYFTRHPAVKPEPRLTMGCEDQYEVMP